MNINTAHPLPGWAVQNLFNMRKNKYKILTAVCTVACLLSGMLLFFLLGNEYMRGKEMEHLVQQHSENLPEPVTTTDDRQLLESEPVILPELETLYLQNPDLAGWLSLPAAEIDFPVVYDREDTPEYYLHRDFNGKYSFSGIPFIGIGANTDSDCLIIYGHNMADDSMFGQLENYCDEQFFNENPVFSFSSLYERSEYRIFAAAYCRILSDGEEGFRYNANVGILTESEYVELLDFLSQNAIQQSAQLPEYGQQIVILSTCDSRSYDGRFIVAGYLVEREES